MHLIDKRVLILSSLARRSDLRPEMNQRRTTRKSPVPHPFAFFLANGWDTKTLNQPLQLGFYVDSTYGKK
jgi:hypothetical protein